MNIALPYHGTNPSGAYHQLVWGRRKRGKVARKTPEGGGFSCLNLCSVQSMHNYSNYVLSSSASEPKSVAERSVINSTNIEIMTHRGGQK